MDMGERGGVKNARTLWMATAPNVIRSHENQLVTKRTLSFGIEQRDTLANQIRLN